MPRRKSVFMETTTIAAETTAYEIQQLLVDAGARQVVTEYNGQGEITGIHFVMSINNQHVPFKMPVQTDKLVAYFKSKQKRYQSRSKDTIQEKAKRVAWRQLRRWIEAQLAFIDTGMAETAEVFMPYLQTGPNETLYQRAMKHGFQVLLPEHTDEP